MTVTVIFDSACSKQEIDEALEQIRSIEGVDPAEPIVPINFNHHEAGLARINLAPTAEVERVMEGLASLVHVTGVLQR